MNELISVIVTTYNWPQALAANLHSLLAQLDRKFEIIVADDGSTAETAQLIASIAANTEIPLRHVHHADQGFRAATIRNKAVAVSQGHYLLFIDGDCVVFPQFIQQHRRLAESGYFVPGNRMLLTQKFTTNILAQAFPLHSQSLAYWLKQRLLGNVNRLSPLIQLPDGAWRMKWAHEWRKAMTCNLAVWRQHFILVNGFDETYQGWGFEDSDLVIRLLHAGLKRKEGRFAVPVVHLWHAQNDRSAHAANYQRLLQRLADQDCIRSTCGYDQYCFQGSHYANILV